MNHEVLGFGQTFWKANVRAMEVVFKVLFFRSSCCVHIVSAWKIGVYMRDMCNTVVVENKVRYLMQRRKDEFSHNVNRLAMMAKQSIE